MDLKMRQCDNCGEQYTAGAYSKNHPTKLGECQVDIVVTGKDKTGNIVDLCPKCQKKALRAVIPAEMLGR